jgi:hypothetical protein
MRFSVTAGQPPDFDERRGHHGIDITRVGQGLLDLHPDIGGHDPVQLGKRRPVGVSEPVQQRVEDTPIPTWYE